MAYKRKTNRPYTKKSDWWEQFEEETQSSQQSQRPSPVSMAMVEYGDTSPESFGVSLAQVSNPSYIISARSTAADGTRTSYRRNRATMQNKKDRFSIIRQGMSAWEESGDFISPRDAIELCQKAYANFALFRNVIDMMAEFSNADIYLTGGSKKSRSFFDGWMKGINIWKLTDQFFREYFRSGNVFMLRGDGKVKDSDFRNVQASYGASILKIPVKYIFLNPCDITSKNSLFYEKEGYCQLLSKYELDRLRHPKDENDKRVLESLTPEAKQKIKLGQYTDRGLEIPLPVDKIYFVFYKKQDYEPFAIPFAFPVLEDINAKQELKNLDNALMRTIENAILLVTTGAEPDKGGVNQQNLTALKNLFRNEGVGRILVADYTTKAEFVIPDLSKVLGPEKYQVLNQDIKEGLQNIVLSDDRQSTAEVKAKIFLDRLREARKAFLNEFLQPEIRRIAKSANMRTWPKAEFKDIDFRDDIQLMKIGLRLIELGVFTPEQGISFMDTGQFPEADSLDEGQEEFVKKREKGYYNPIVGGVPETPPPFDPNKNNTINKTPKQRGRPLGAKQKQGLASLANIQSVVYDIEDLRRQLEEDLKTKYNKESLSEEQKQIVDQISESIVISKEQKDWLTIAKECVKDSRNISKLNIPLDGVADTVREFGLDDYAAAILYHSYDEDTSRT